MMPPRPPHPVSVTGELCVQCCLTEYETNPRICVWIAKQKEPPLMILLDDKHARRSSQSLGSECSGTTWEVSMKLESTTVLSSYKCFVGAHLIVRQSVPIELLTVGESDSAAKLLRPEQYDQVVGTACFSVFRSMVDSSQRSLIVPFLRTGTRGPAKAWGMFRGRRLISSEDEERAEKMGKRALYWFECSSQRVTKWTQEIFAEGRRAEKANPGALSTDHPIFAIPGQDRGLPPEIYYAPRMHPFPEEHYARLLRAAMFAVRVTPEQLEKSLANVDKNPAMPCRVLGRMLALVGCCMHYVPDILYRSQPVSWKGSEGKRLPSLQSHIVVEFNDMYDDPLLTLAGDCEEAVRLVYWACFYFRNAGKDFKDPLLRELWKLATRYVFGATIVTSHNPSGEKVSANVRTNARAVPGEPHHSHHHHHHRDEEEDDDDEDPVLRTGDNGGGKKSSSSNGGGAHVICCAIPLVRFAEMTGKNNSWTKAMLDFDKEASEASVGLPTLILEGTNIADPLQRRPGYNPSPHLASPDGGAEEDFTLRKLVNKAENLRAARLLVDLQNRDDCGCDYNMFVRLYTWDLAFFKGGLRHTRFVFVDQEGRSGLDVQDMLDGKKCGLRTVGPMPKDICEESLELAAITSPVTALRLAPLPTSSPAPDLVSSPPDDVYSLLLCIKSHHFRYVLPQLLLKLQMQGLQADNHHLSLNEEMGCLLLRVWRTSAHSSSVVPKTMAKTVY